MQLTQVILDCAVHAVGKLSRRQRCEVFQSESAVEMQKRQHVFLCLQAPIAINQWLERDDYLEVLQAEASLGDAVVHVYAGVARRSAARRGVVWCGIYVV